MGASCGWIGAGLEGCGGGSEAAGQGRHLDKNLIDPCLTIFTLFVSIV